MLSAIVMTLIGCSNYVCFDPAPSVAYVATDGSYATQAVMVDGVLYTGPTLSRTDGAVHGTDRRVTTTITADLRSVDGRQIQLVASFDKWVAQVNAGKLHKTQVHLVLLSGAIQP